MSRQAWFQAMASGLWHELRAAAYDGNPELVLDCIEFEREISKIEDPRVRFSVILRSYGEDAFEIAQVVGGRRSARQLERAAEWQAARNRNREDC